MGHCRTTRLTQSPRFPGTKELAGTSWESRKTSPIWKKVSLAVRRGYLTGSGSVNKNNGHFQG